jgi:hypothetical protein
MLFQLELNPIQKFIQFFFESWIKIGFQYNNEFWFSNSLLTFHHSVNDFKDLKKFKESLKEFKDSLTAFSDFSFWCKNLIPITD